MTHIQTGETEAWSWPLLIETFIITAASMTIAMLEKCPDPANWWAKQPNTHLWNLTSSSYHIDSVCVCVYMEVCFDCVLFFALWWAMCYDLEKQQ